mmetsp:Transcript_13317/g.38690  ORF Transcript_13317/g.38690 Transcript_13317/m.38690 type:complete len:107 (+) Transcript_13317:1219-1539(+)
MCGKGLAHRQLLAHLAAGRAALALSLPLPFRIWLWDTPRCVPSPDPICPSSCSLSHTCTYLASRRGTSRAFDHDLLAQWRACWLRALCLIDATLVELSSTGIAAEE